MDSSAFSSDNDATIYYFLGYTGWTSSFAGLPAVPLNPFECMTNDGTITITGYTGPGGAVNIPSTINSLPVSGIASNAFYENISLTSIGIPSSVAGIGADAFHGCSGLTSLTIPTNAISVGTGAFSDCAGLTNVTIPGNLTAFSNVFYGCTNLTNASIANGVTRIGAGEFYGCFGLTSVTIPASVTSIREDAFHGCSGLIDLTIPASVASIGEDAFEGCTSLAGLYFQGNAPGYIDPTAFDEDTQTTVYYLVGTSGWSSVFAGVPAVADYTSQGQFIYTTNAGAITITDYIGPGGDVAIPPSITGLPVVCIGNGNGFVSVFSGNLTSVSIPDSVTFIGGAAFRRLHRPRQHYNSHQRQHHRGQCVRGLHQPDQRHHPHQRRHYWRWCIPGLYRSDQRDDS